MILDIQSVNVGVENDNVSVSHTPNQAQLRTLMIVRSMVRMVTGMVMMIMMMMMVLQSTVRIMILLVVIRIRHVIINRPSVAGAVLYRVS